MNKFLLSVLCMGFLTAEEITPPVEPVEAAPNVEKISEAFGHLLGKNLESMGLKFDIAKVVKGLQDEKEGKTSPMNETELSQAMATIQETAFKEAASENLKEAEKFLSSNKAADGIKVIEEGKLQYKVTHEGKGVAIDENSTPLLRFTGKLLDGSVFFNSSEDEMCPLDEAFPGLRKGLLGMKEGEKRTLFIHPDLAFGKKQSQTRLLHLKLKLFKPMLRMQKLWMRFLR